jgi:hypothetical protein
VSAASVHKCHSHGCITASHKYPVLHRAQADAANKSGRCGQSDAEVEVLRKELHSHHQQTSHTHLALRFKNCYAVVFQAKHYGAGAVAVAAGQQQRAHARDAAAVLERARLVPVHGINTVCGREAAWKGS